MQLRRRLLIAFSGGVLVDGVVLGGQRVTALLFSGQTRRRAGGQRGRRRTRAMLVTRGPGDARQRDCSGLRCDDTCPARLANRPAATDVESDQIGDCVEGLVLELVLRSLVHRVWLYHDLSAEETRISETPSVRSKVKCRFSYSRFP